MAEVRLDYKTQNTVSLYDYLSEDQNTGYEGTTQS